MLVDAVDSEVWYCLRLEKQLGTFQSLFSHSDDLASRQHILGLSICVCHLIGLFHLGVEV